jgi:hypothetical protein
MLRNNTLLFIIAYAISWKKYGILHIAGNMYNAKFIYVRFKGNKTFTRSFLKMLTELLTIIFMEILIDFCEILLFTVGKVLHITMLCLRRPVQFRAFISKF